MNGNLITLVRVTAPVRQQVEDSLRLLIAEGNAAPGDRVVERDLCERLAVSRPVVREALRQLAAEGLVTALPQGGLIVTRLTRREARDIYAVRAALEGLAAHGFTTIAGDAEMVGIVRLVEAVETAGANGDAAALRKAKNAFYAALVGGCGNAVLAQTLRSLHNRIQLLRTVALGDRKRAGEAVREIRQIVNAMMARDPGRASALAARHVEKAAAAMERGMQRAEKVQSGELTSNHFSPLRHAVAAGRNPRRVRP